MNPLKSAIMIRRRRSLNIKKKWSFEKDKEQEVMQYQRRGCGCRFQGGMRTDIAVIRDTVDGGRADKSTLLGGFFLLSWSDRVAPAQQAVLVLAAARTQGVVQRPNKPFKLCRHESGAVGAGFGRFEGGKACRGNL